MANKFGHPLAVYPPNKSMSRIQARDREVGEKTLNPVEIDGFGLTDRHAFSRFWMPASASQS